MSGGWLHAEATTTLRSVAVVCALLFLAVVYLYTTEQQNLRMRRELERHSRDLERRLQLPDRYDAHAPGNRRRHAADVEQHRRQQEEADAVVSPGQRQIASSSPSAGGSNLAELLAAVRDMRARQQSVMAGHVQSLDVIRSQIDQLTPDSDQQQLQQLEQQLEQQMQRQQQQLNQLEREQQLLEQQRQQQLIQQQQHIQQQQQQKKVVVEQRETIATLLLTYNRPDYLRRTLDNVLHILPDGYPLFVSQDGSDAATSRALREHPRAGDFTVFEHKDRPAPRVASQGAYWYISQHYGWALSKLFREYPGYSAVIIVEDDMQFAPDFYAYFAATLPVLRRDPSLWCISAWNDIGNEGLVHSATALRRTDFFPGLGWLLTRELWAELAGKWPPAYWDDWMREPAQRQGRQCIQPEVSRSGTFGEKGSSGGQFYDLIRRIRLSSELVDWSQHDLSYLERANWDSYFWGQLFRDLTVVASAADVVAHVPGRKYVYYYADHRSYVSFVRNLPVKYQIISDEKAGVPRSSYAGVVYFDIDDQGGQLFLAPVSARH